jgi:hypothetical protein
MVGVELLDRPEPGRKVVAVVPIAEDRIEPGQCRSVAVDGALGAVEPRSKGVGVYRCNRIDRRRGGR